MRKDDIDHRVNVGLFMGLIVFVVVYGVLITRYDGWGLALGWIGALMVAAPKAWTIAQLVDAALAVAPGLPKETPPERRRGFTVIQGGRE